LPILRRVSDRDGRAGLPTPPAGRGRLAALPPVRKLRNLAALGRQPRTRAARKLYLDLLERAVLHTLYSPPDRGAEPDFSRSAFTEALDEAGLQVKPLTDAETRAQGRDWPQYAQTMIGVRRVRNLRRCVQTAINEGIDGDLIEAGCWRGGAAILMRGIVKANASDKLVYAADSFQGVPPPDVEHYPADQGDLNYTAEQLAIPLEEVRDNFRRYGLLDDGVRFVEGWFKDTLPGLSDRTWSVIRLDGDLYESTMDGLENLYPRLAVGGFLIIDDFGWENCRKAVEDFRARYGISEPIERIDWVGAYWRRER
jgi:O-methyltransferase